MTYTPSSIRCQDSNPQPFSCESSALTTRPAGPNLFVSRANIEDKKFGRANFGLEI
jgi:hypothetical protein